MSGAQSPDGEAGVGITCFLVDCVKTAAGTPSCIRTCFYSGDVLSPPPPPSPLAGKSSQSHLAPFLIAAVSILGIFFLLLTTCTIILRHRFSRRRRHSPAIFDHPMPDDDYGVVDHPIWLINTVGLQQSVIDSITAFKFSKLDGILIDGSDCSVCLTEFDDGDDLRLLPKCSHAFHVNCIDTWLRSHKNCPVCRAPVVKDASFRLNLRGSSDLGRGEDDHSDNNAENDEQGSVLTGGGGESSVRGEDDVLVDLPIEGGKLAEILKKNRDLRIRSDLGEYHRFKGENYADDSLKRSISYNSSASLAIHRAMESEGSSSSINRLLIDDNKVEFDHNKESKKGSSISMKSSSIGRSLQKGSVSMKRSISSSSKLFSFRRTKSQASILPLSIQISDVQLADNK